MAQDWLNWMQRTLQQIDDVFPPDSQEVKQELVQRFSDLLDMNDSWLDQWLELQDQFYYLMEKHPELVKEGQTGTASLTEQQEYSNDPNGDQAQPLGEMWINEHVLRQFREGQGFYQLWMLLDANESFADVVAEEPDFILGRLYLAVTCFHRGNFEEAEQHLKLALNTAEHAEFKRFSHHMLGCVYVKQGQEVQAIREFSHALSLNREDPDTLFNLGACHFRLNSIRLAIPCFEQALLYADEDWESMLYLAHCYTLTGQLDAGTHWKQMAYETSQKPWMITSIVHSLEDAGEWEKAKSWSLYCVGKHPEWAEGYHGVGWNLWQLERHPDAILWLKKALSLKHDDPNMLFSYWTVLQTVGTQQEKKKAEQHISHHLSASPLWQLAKSAQFREKGEKAQAEQLLTPLLNSEHGQVQGAAHYQLAHLFMSRQRWQEAVQHFIAAREQDQFLRETWLFEGICHYLNGDAETSRTCLELYRSYVHEV